jgi:hypothetical protein
MPESSIAITAARGAAAGATTGMIAIAPCASASLAAWSPALALTWSLHDQPAQGACRRRAAVVSQVRRYAPKLRLRRTVERLP